MSYYKQFWVKNVKTDSLFRILMNNGLFSLGFCVKVNSKLQKKQAIHNEKQCK